MSLCRLAAFFIILSLLGCATTQQNGSNLEVQELRNQLSALQTEGGSKDEQLAKQEELLKEKEQQILYLREALDKEAKERATLATQVAVLSGKYKPASPKISVRQTQIALKNAGYDAGVIDGVMGSRTRKAIRDFQKDNSLPITGNIDKATWFKLRAYLNRRVK